MSLTSDVKGGTYRQCLSLQTKIRDKVEDEGVSHHSLLRVGTAEKLLEIGDVSQIRHTFLGITRKLTAIDEFWVVRWKEGTKTRLPRRERSPPLLSVWAERIVWFERLSLKVTLLIHWSYG